MVAIAIVRKKISEKIDEVTSRGDPWEELACEGVLDQHLMQNSDIHSLLLSPLEQMLNLPS